MTTQTQTLADFLLARIAEDESDVRARGTQSVGHTDRCIYEGGFEGTSSCDCGAVDRVLAECEAKRRIVEYCEAVAVCDIHGRELASGCEGCSVADNVGLYDTEILRLLALPYSDHPDYREGWRP